MKIANEFTVSAPIEQAWSRLCDLEQMIPLMPGAQLIGHEGDEYLGKVKVKVGPVTSEFSGKVHFVEQDRNQHRAVFDAKGKEARGTGNAAATVAAQLHEVGERTRVTVDTDLKIVGKLAQFGSGMLQQVSEKLLGQFVDSLEAELAAQSSESPQGTPPATEAAPIDLLQLADGGQLKKYGSALLAALTVLLLIWVLRRRRGWDGHPCTVAGRRPRGVRGSAGSAPSRRRDTGVRQRSSEFGAGVAAVGAAYAGGAVLGRAVDPGQPCRRTGHVRCGIRFAVRGIWQRRTRRCQPPTTAHCRPAHTGGRRRAPRQAAILCRPSPESALGYSLADDGQRRSGRTQPHTARCPAQPHCRPGRRAIRPVRSRRSASARRLAGGHDGALAAAAQHAIRVQPARQAHRPAGDDERVAVDWLGVGAVGTDPAPPTPQAGAPALRCEPLDAALRRHLSASDAGGGAAPGRGHPEVFAFSTSLTRLTSVLSHRSAEMALHRANARVTDRYGGTFIGRSVAALLAPPHGNALRGAVVIIASDGWDSDPPDVLVHALTRVRRRAELLVWLNPRAAHPEFQPRAGSMAAALPYCDLFLPAHSLAGLHQLLLALAGAR